MAAKRQERNMLKEAEEAIATARCVVRLKAPYVMQTVYGLIPIPSNNIPTLAVTEGLVMLYNVDYVLAQTPTRLGAGLMHEVNHIIRDHLPRGKRAPDKELWNDAGDITINDDLKQAGWDVAESWLFSSTFKFKPGLTTEDYYELLEKLQQKLTVSGGGLKGMLGQSNAKAPPHESPGVGQGHCGGCAGNKEDNQKEEETDAAEGRTELERKIIFDKTMLDIIAHAEGPGRGNMPAWMKELATKAMEPSKIPWGKKLQSLVRKTTGQISAGGNDFSMSRPSKRSLMRGIIRPGMIDQTPEGVLIIDTSGSMGINTQIRDALREMVSCMRAAGMDRTWVIQADAGIGDVRRVSTRDLASINIVGRGGTSFIPAIEAAMKLRPRPNFIAYFTDGDGRAPEQQPPGCAFIWCVVPSPYRRRPAPWGHVIVMEDGAQPLEYEPDDD